MRGWGWMGGGVLWRQWIWLPELLQLFLPLDVRIFVYSPFRNTIIAFFAQSYGDNKRAYGKKKKAGNADEEETKTHTKKYHGPDTQEENLE